MFSFVGKRLLLNSSARQSTGYCYNGIVNCSSTGNNSITGGSSSSLCKYMVLGNGRCYYSTSKINNNIEKDTSIDSNPTTSGSIGKQNSGTTSGNVISTATMTTTPSMSDIPVIERKPCWCILNCKLESKRIHVSKVKPITYDAEKGYVMGKYNSSCEQPLTKSRKKVIEALTKAKEIFEEEEEEKRRQLEKVDEDDDDDDDEKKETKKLFKTQEEKEVMEKKYPVLNDDTTSIGPIHVLYKNEWVITVVERMETDNKENEPYFVLKFKTPIRQTLDITFNIESLSYLASIEKLISFRSSIECGDKEFDKEYLVKSGSKSVVSKGGTKWLMESRTHLREALINLKLHLLPSLGFNYSGINLQLKREDVVKCRQGSSLEFPSSTYQLCLEIDSTESIWKKDPVAIEKILYLYTVVFDSIVSLGYTEDSPIDQVYI